MSAGGQRTASEDAALVDRFEEAFGGLARIGRDPRGGWTRLAWTPADLEARAWFQRTATALGLPVEVDRNANLWAWWGEGSGDVIATGSHLDTVPGGGAYDGALGVVSAFLAIEDLQRRGVRPRRPVAVVAFVDEEGGRFGVPTLGSRLLTGDLDPSDVVERRDAQGERLGDALRQAGFEPSDLGPDPERLRRLQAFLELHVEQGKAMEDLGVPVTLCARIWPHGRWRLTIEGEANHAGTTHLEHRRDPVLVLAAAASEAHGRAAAAGTLATLGRVEVHPNAPNSVAERVTAWLDARAATDEDLRDFVAGWWDAVQAAGDLHGCGVRLKEESWVPGVEFDQDLATRIAPRLQTVGAKPHALDTAAGHDAGALAGHVPSAMLFVRNPTGVSHSPREHATIDDCVEGIRVLADVIDDLACR